MDSMGIFDLFRKTELKQDGLVNTQIGMGTTNDKLVMSNPDYNYTSTPRQNLSYWESLSLLRKIINAPAEDSVRNGWKIRVSNDNPELSSVLARYLQNRLHELGMAEILMQAIRYQRIYSNGCLLYYIVSSDVLQSETNLGQPIPEFIDELKAINIVEERKFQVEYLTESPLSAYYNKPIISIEDVRIHPSRYKWLVNDYNRELKTGKSILDDALEIAKGHSTANWSLSTMIFEMATKIFKSPEVGRSLKDDKLKDFLRRIRMALSSQSILALNTEEEFAKSTYNLSGLKEILDYILDGVAIMAEIPQARLKGAAHGVLSSGAYDMQSYFESVARMQSNYLYKPLTDSISLILREKKTLMQFPVNFLTSLDWEVEFHPLWELSPLDQAEIEKKRSERDKLDIESGKVTPMEARKLDTRLKVLEDDFNVDEI